jgi:recombination protein RecR
MYSYPSSFSRVIENLSRLPGIGHKTAERLAIFLFKSPPEKVKELGAAIAGLKEGVSYCKLCGNFAADERCSICSNIKRDHSIICVVEEPKDIIAIERANQYYGLYHVLRGAISPLDGIGPDDLAIGELMERLKNGNIKEVILATSTSAEGETTANYLCQQLKPSGVKLTRIACGIPVGSSLEYIDEITLGKSLSARIKMTD